MVSLAERRFSGICAIAFERNDFAKMRSALFTYTTFFYIIRKNRVGRRALAIGRSAVRTGSCRADEKEHPCGSPAASRCDIIRSHASLCCHSRHTKEVVFMSGKSIASSDTTQLFSTPFHRAYWKLAAREFTSLRVLILAAACCNRCISRQRYSRSDSVSERRLFLPLHLLRNCGRAALCPVLLSR